MGATHPQSETGARGHDVDVAIIGAGFAGVSAARVLAARGLSCRILEAAGRTGGRACSVEPVPGTVFDRGCAWLHCGDINPLTALVDAHGIRYGSNFQPRYHIQGRFLDAAECQDLAVELHEILEAVAEVGRAGRDAAAADVLSPDSPHAGMVDYLINAIYGVPPHMFSTAELAEEIETGENWIVWDGMGRLIQRLAEGLDINHNCPVRRIERHARGARVISDNGSLNAGAVIVTVSTGVLRAGNLEFDPPLPDEKLAALDMLPMGRSEKIALVFDRDRFGLPPNSYLAMERQGEIRGFYFYGGPQPLLIGYSGGDQAEALIRMDEAEAVNQALAFLEHAFGTRLAPHLVASMRTGWMDDPWIRGGYSAARPGGHARRHDLARPVHERIFFAGEATEPTRFASAHGAWYSGERAAGEAIAALR